MDIERYAKYYSKNRCSLKLNGGGKKIQENNIVQFINKSSFGVIESELLKMMKNSDYCDKIMGEGFFGKVYQSQIGDAVKIIVKNEENEDKEIEIPIVIKKAKNNGNFKIFEKDKKLYIYGQTNLTVETIILSFTNTLIDKNPHLPRLIGYSMCDSKNNNYVDTIIIEKYGLDDEIEIPYDGTEREMVFWGKNGENFKSNLATLWDLQKYIFLKENNNEIILPNKIKCRATDIFDNIMISFLIGHKNLVLNNIFAFDMHTGNIFIQWINDESYFNKTKMNDVEYIIYKINDKYIKIKNLGFIIKLGDLGMSYIKTQNKSVYICGQAVDLEKNDNTDKLEELLDPKFLIITLFFNLAKYIKPKLLNTLPIYQIMNSEPYNNYRSFSEIKKTDMANLLTHTEILEKYYSKYYVELDEKDEKDIDKKKELFINCDL